jgi:hypothetical protein
MIGIPYAYAVIDKHGYGDRCPFCGKVFYGMDESQETVEDAVTKGASAQYAAHYAAEHEGLGEADRRFKESAKAIKK